MIPWSLLPGYAQWGPGLDALVARSEALWIYGPPGSGASTLAEDLASRRGVACLRAATAEEATAWLAQSPGAVVSAPVAAPGAVPCLALRLGGLEEEPDRVPALLAHIAQEEGVEGPLPPSLGALPCEGNLRELRNRLLRWGLLKQLPDLEAGGPPRLEAEDLATNLHDLERYLLHRALRRTYGNRSAAALRLGISRPQLYLLIRRHGDPVLGQPGTGEMPQRLLRSRNAQNSSPGSRSR